MGPAELTVVLSSLKSAGDLLKSIRETKDANLVMGKVFDLSREILDAQQGAIAAQASQAQLLDDVRQLKARLADFENWSNEEKRYALTDFGGNTFAYLLRPEMSNGEPMHRLCPVCFQRKNKSILQFRSTICNQDHFDCPGCKTEFSFGIEQEMSSVGVRVPGGWMGV